MLWWIMLGSIKHGLDIILSKEEEKKDKRMLMIIKFGSGETRT